VKKITNMDNPVDLNNPKADNIKLERLRSVAYTIERSEPIEYKDWCKFIKKESDQTLYN